MTAPATSNAAVRVNGAPALSVESVVKRFETSEGAFVAVDDVSFAVRPGEFLSVIGPSGCGKSTLFNIIGGLQTQYDGRVSVGGTVVSGPHASIGMVFQEESTFPWRTVIENVAFPLEITGVPKAERLGRARHFIELVGLAGFDRSYPAELSGGMRQRVALARALAQDADVLLMDEPFGSLDAMTRDLLHDELDRICAGRRLTIIFVTHNVREAVRLGDRVVVLSSRPGRVVDQFAVPIGHPRRIDSAPVAELAGRITDRLREEMTRHDR